MSTTRPGFRIRPGTCGDAVGMARVYVDALSHDAVLMDNMFPKRNDCPDEFALRLRRFFWRRWWTPGWVVDVLVHERAGSGEAKAKKEEDLVVGFAWWKRPESDLSWRERWLTPCHALYHNIEVLEEKHIIRTRPWFYLSLLAVSPTLHGSGLGGALLRHGLDRADAAVATKADAQENIPDPKSTVNESASDAHKNESDAHKDDSNVDESEDKSNAKPDTHHDAHKKRGGKKKGSGAEFNANTQVQVRSKDAAAACCYLIALKGLEPFYLRFGFKEVGRVNTGELSHWGGGAFMVREA